jgi:opacity protein-like surface antigen
MTRDGGRDKRQMKSWLIPLLALICSFGSSPCLASDTASGQGFYVGLFGGAGTASSMSARQEGGFYLPGPLNTRVGVDAQGRAGGEPVGVLGLQAGYEWKRQTFGQSDWALKPAAELEGIYIGQQAPVGDMPITPSVLGTQYVTLPMTVGVVLANAVFTFQTPWSSKIFPYLGVGAGVARLSIQGANSTNPSEPGINHFDSGPDASATAFAMQFKAGLKGEVARNLLLFAEYRHLTINPTQYTFGETLPPHLPTDSWTVSLGRQSYNLFVAGLQVKF